MHKQRKKDDCIDIYPGLDKKLSVSKVKFLSNNGNKSRFLFMLGDFLIGNSITVLHAEKDADVLICREAVEWSNQVDVSVIGDDTDLLVILLHMTKHFAFDHRLFLTTKSYIYDIEKIRSVLGRRHVNTILLCHALTGSDTTSRIHGVGKDRLFKMIASIDESVIDAFYSENSTPATIKHVGEHLMLQLISSKSRSLDEARLSVLEQKSQSSSADIKCEQLPPTSGAAEQHSYRVYHQLQAWDENDLDPISWGWTMNNGAHVPVTTLMSTAPKKLIQNISCNCLKSGCGNACSCRKAGINCGSTCLKCQDNCTNVPAEDS